MFLVLCFVQKFCEDCWGMGLDVMEDVLKLERYVYQLLLDLYNILDNDFQVQSNYGFLFLIYLFYFYYYLCFVFSFVIS